MILPVSNLNQHQANELEFLSFRYFASRGLAMLKIKFKNVLRLSSTTYGLKCSLENTIFILLEHDRRLLFPRLPSFRDFSEVFCTFLFIKSLSVM